MDTLAIRHLDNYHKLLEDMLESEGRKSNFLERAIDVYVAFLDAHPDFRALALGRHISAETRERYAGPDMPGTMAIKRHIANRLKFGKSKALDLALRIANQTGERLIAYAYEQPPEEPKRIIGELKRLLGSYFLSFLKDGNPKN